MKETNAQKLSVEKRKSYETVESLRRRFGRMAGQSFISPDSFQSLCELLDAVAIEVDKARIENDRDEVE